VREKESERREEGRKAKEGRKEGRKGQIGQNKDTHIYIYISYI
jgi:hypothetical protein